jgi:hypothetical protein
VLLEGFGLNLSWEIAVITEVYHVVESEIMLNTVGTMATKFKKYHIENW